MATALYSPLVFDESTKTHAPLAYGLAIDPSHILINAQVNGNLLQKDAANGLSVTLLDMVSSDPDNKLTIVDGKLLVKDTLEENGLVSKQENNLARYGNDGGVFIDCNDILSNGTENLLYINPTDNRLVFTRSDAKTVVEAVVSESVKTVSTDANNVLTSGSDGGAYVSPTTILQTVETGISGGSIKVVSSDRNNVIVSGSDRGAYLGEAELVETVNDLARSGDITIVSANANNIITRGTDGGSYLQANAVIEAVQDAVTTGGFTIVSRNIGNIITRGTDGGAYLDSSDVVVELSTDAGNLLKKDTSGKLIVSSSDVASAAATGAVSTSADNLLKQDANGKLIVSASEVASGLTSTSTANLLSVDAQGKLLLTPTQLVSTQADNAIQAGTDGKLYAYKTTARSLVDANDKILVVSNDGNTMSTELTMTYNNTTGLLSLLGKNNQSVATVTISAGGSVLERVEVVVNPAGMPAGTYLAMTFRKSDGTLETVYADLSAIGDTYTSGNGINIAGQTISAKLGAGLAFDASGNIMVNKATAATSLISANADNAISTGTDGGLYVALDCGELD